jgi:vancomycin resistance protein YoaR
MDARITPETIGASAPPLPDADAGARMTPTPETEARRRFSRRRARRGRIWAVVAVVIVVALLAGFAVVQLVVRGHVGDGVRVAGVSLQGQTLDQATATLESGLAPRLSTVTLQTGEGAPLTVALSDLGMGLDARATAQAALARGRHRLPGGLVFWVPGGGDVAPVLAVQPAVYSAGLATVRATVDTAPKDARLKLSGDSVEVVPAVDGRTVDALALERAIRASVVAGKAYSGPLPLAAAAPHVSTAMAQSRAGAAAAYLSTPVTLRYRGTAVKLRPAAMADMLTVNTAGGASSYPLTFDNERTRARLRRLFPAAEIKPVNARLIVSKDGTTTITQSKEGQTLDMERLVEDLNDAAAGGGLRTVFVALKPALPSLSSDELATQGFSSVGTQFVTYFDPRNKTRVRNIALAAHIVDGAVVRPGAVFSLNGALGPRTTNRGFDYAPVIASDNVLRQGVGGGICQYATTLFNAVFFAGLPVVERHSHSLYISHYPIGRDATVSWGSADFKFRNDTGRDVTIRSWVEDDHVTVALVGKTGRKVSTTTGTFYDIRKPAHGQSDPRVIYDSDLGPGVIRWERGVNGLSVKVWRTVRSAAGAVLFRDAFASHYTPMDWIKRVGT